MDRAKVIDELFWHVLDRTHHRLCAGL